MTLNEILTQVAQGKLSVADAEKLIRQGPHRRSMPMWGILMFIGIGLLFACVGIGLGIRSWSLESNARRADGTVLRLVSSGNRGGMSPIIQYEVDGRTFEIQSSISSSPPGYSVGEKVKVLYLPDQPAAGSLDSFAERWLLPLIFGGLGSVFALVGVIILLTRGGTKPNKSA
jgi:hypothetical protein